MSSVNAIAMGDWLGRFIGIDPFVTMHETEVFLFGEDVSICSFLHQCLCIRRNAVNCWRRPPWCADVRDFRGFAGDETETSFDTHTAARRSLLHGLGQRTSFG